MILVVASIIDQAAAALANELASTGEASLFTISDLACAPLNLQHPDFAASTITINGRITSVGVLTGVVNLLPAVVPDEVGFYAPEEREYQAAELHALMTFFLASLPCPVINRATAVGLCGPVHSPLGWRQLATSMNIPLTFVELDSDAFVNPFTVRAGSEYFEIACVGDRVISPTGSVADEQTVALAKRADVVYLNAVFSRETPNSPRLLTAKSLPDVTLPATRLAIKDYFAARRQ